MRITKNELNSIIEILSLYIVKNAELRLFGSRVDDQALGGDIDLLLIVRNDNTKQKLIVNKAEILSDIKHKIGEQKLDLVIVNDSEIKQTAFLRMIFPKSIQLMQW